MVICAPNTSRLSEHRDSHIKFRHPQEDRSKFHQLRKKLDIIPATFKLPPEERNWTCAFCQASLPYIHSKKQRDLSVENHYATAHRRRKRTRSHIQKARWKQLRTCKESQPTLAASYKKAGQKRSAQAKARRDLTLGGHQLVKLARNADTWPKEGGMLGPKTDKWKNRRKQYAKKSKSKQPRQEQIEMFTCVKPQVQRYDGRLGCPLQRVTVQSSQWDP